MPDVKTVKYLRDYKLEIVFEDGVRGTVDLSNYTKKGGIFSRLADKTYFKQVYINNDIGTICWQNGADIAPETLYSMATGKPLPDWTKTRAWQVAEKKNKYT